ncbi:MAG TPA: hypothetical protein VMR86_00340 [Myxococcota bacterium]|nr:hypothetical protein [Myxococcota bacterium]
MRLAVIGALLLIASAAHAQGSRGDCIEGGYCDVNPDTSAIFASGSSAGGTAVDGTIVFGIEGAVSRARSPGSVPEPGGAALVCIGLIGLLCARVSKPS